MKKNIIIMLGLVAFGSSIIVLSQANDPRMTYHTHLTQRINKRSNDFQYRKNSDKSSRAYRPFSMRYGEIKNTTSRLSYQKNYTIIRDKIAMNQVQNDFFGMSIPANWSSRYEDGFFMPLTTNSVKFQAKFIGKKACDNSPFALCARNIIRTKNTMINSSKRVNRYYRQHPDKVKTNAQKQITDPNSIFKFEDLSGIYNEKRRYVNESRDTMTVINRQRGFTNQANAPFYEESQIALNMGKEEFIAQRVVEAPNGDIIFLEIVAPENQAESVIPMTKQIFESITF